MNIYSKIFVFIYLKSNQNILDYGGTVPGRNFGPYGNAIYLVYIGQVPFALFILIALLRSYGLNATDYTQIIMLSLIIWLFILRLVIYPKDKVDNLIHEFGQQYGLKWEPQRMAYLLLYILPPLLLITEMILGAPRFEHLSIREFFHF